MSAGMMHAPELVEALRARLGRSRVLISAQATRRFRRGFRGAEGAAAAVVVPVSLVMLWRAIVICAEHGAVIIVQAANTGLTGGSTPPPASPDDRPWVIISTRKLRAIHSLNQGRQVICLPGATLHSLEQALRPMGREPHSVIGSTCLGATVVGGVCNNSGGALVRRGPAYTEMALIAAVGRDGRPVLRNTLGVDLGDDPEEMLQRLEVGNFVHSPIPGRASDPDYTTHVRDLEASTPARFNADPRRLHGASGSAGHLAVFAVRLDTFPTEVAPVTLCCATNWSQDLAALRQALLAAPGQLPISAEYIHRDALDAADSHGRDLFHAIRLLGTHRIPALFAFKSRMDLLAWKLKIPHASDSLLQRIARGLPSIYTQRMRMHRQLYAHHLILKVSAQDADVVSRLVADRLKRNGGDFFWCDGAEADSVALHRYVTASAATRMQLCLPQRYAHLVAFDVALPRNSVAWNEQLPQVLRRDVALALNYGHFLCHVFHRDYLLHPHVDPEEFKARMIEWLDERGIEFPAEHNVGRQYRAKPSLEAFYRTIDPTNSFNPGIGQTPYGRNWIDAAVKGEL